MEAKLGSKPRTLQKALSALLLPALPISPKATGGRLEAVTTHSLTARHIHANQVSVMTVPVAGSSTLFSHDSLFSLAAGAIDECVSFLIAGKLRSKRYITKN